MRNVICGLFDPVSQKDLQYILEYRRTERISDLFLCVRGEGILSAEKRRFLLERAVRPYRRIHVLAGDCEGHEMEPADEEKIRGGEFRLAAKGIRKILIEEGLYFENICDTMCKPSRAVHSRGVAQTAAHLAEVHRLDVRKAYNTGLLHDITKRMSDEEGQKIIALYKPEWLSISPKVWHSYTAVVWLKQNMGLRDHAVLSAIEHHTLGDGCSDLDHILYIADKIEPGRGYDTSKQMKAAEKDLKSAQLMIREESRAYIFEKEGVHV